MSKVTGADRLRLGPPDERRSRELYRRAASHYDRSARIAARYRTLALERAVLDEGDRVLDVGCGTGLMFAPTREAIGASGQIVGIEPSEEMRRIAAPGSRRRAGPTCGWSPRRGRPRPPAWWPTPCYSPWSMT